MQTLIQSSILRKWARLFAASFGLVVLMLGLSPLTPAYGIDTGPPSLSSASVNGTTLILSFDEALDASASPASSAFSVAVDGTARGVLRVLVSGTSVTLNLASSVEAGETVTVGYTVPTGASASPLQDAAGNPVASFSGETATNATETVNSTGPFTVEWECPEDPSSATGFSVGLLFSEPVKALKNGKDKLELIPDPGITTLVVSGGGGRTIAHHLDYVTEYGIGYGFIEALSGELAVRLPAGGYQDIGGSTNPALDKLYVSMNREVSVGDADATEGTDGTADFEVTLGSRNDCETVTVEWATADGTATAGEDYTTDSGTLTFGQGETTKTVSIEVLDDTASEADESFTLELSNASGATIADAEATGTISDDAADGNTAPTGLPTISGTAQVGQTLTASRTGIADADGLTDATFAWQWIANDGTNDTDIAHEFVPAAIPAVTDDRFARAQYRATREAQTRAHGTVAAADEEEWMNTDVATTESIRTRRHTDLTDAVQYRKENGGPAPCNHYRLAFGESLAQMTANGWNVEPV